MTSTLNSTRKRSGQNRHAMSFKPVALFQTPGHFMPTDSEMIQPEEMDYNYHTDGVLSVQD